MFFNIKIIFGHFFKMLNNIIGWARGTRWDKINPSRLIQLQVAKCICRWNWNSESTTSILYFLARCKSVFYCMVQFCSFLRQDPISFSALFVLLFSLLNNKILHVDVILKTKCFKNLKIVQLQSKISDRVSKSLNSTRLARGQCLCFCSDDVSRGINLLAAGGEKTPFCR